VLQPAPSGSSVVDLLPSAGGGYRHDDSMGRYCRPVPSFGDWPPLAVLLGQQTEMSPLQGQVDINFGAAGRGEARVGLVVAVHNNISEWLLYK
jgi:hypothetical protein